MSQNIPYLVEMQICTFFNPDLMWHEQFIPLMGQEEVDKLDKKLKSLNIAGKSSSDYYQVIPDFCPYQVWIIYRCNILTCSLTLRYRTQDRYRRLEAGLRLVRMV